MLVREDLVDYGEDNPEWEVFPNTPPTDYSSTDTRVRWCFLPGPGCHEVVGTSASPLAWDVKASNEPADRHDLREQLLRRPQLVQQRPLQRRQRAGDAEPEPRIQLRLDQPVARGRGARRPSSRPPLRNDIDAARANLFAMHNRMHDWSYHLGFTETTFNMQDDNFGRGGKMNDPEQGNAQAGGVTGGPPDFRGAGQRQSDHPAGRPPADHQHVPVAADRGSLLRAVRRRRLRHVGDRARVHPRHHQPDDRRAGAASARRRV